jgi:hypothetical protein
MPLTPSPLSLNPKSPPRRRWDQYDTPPWQVDALVDHVPAIKGTVWEPCVGDGSLITQLLDRRPELTVTTMDLDPKKAAMLTGDATDPAQWKAWLQKAGRPDWVITNPPFIDAFPILQLAVATARVGVIFLSRLSFIEPTHARGQWLKEHAHDQRIVLERWSYTGNGRTDASTTEWLVYVKDWRILTPPFGISAYGYKPKSDAPR